MTPPPPTAAGRKAAIIVPKTINNVTVARGNANSSPFLKSFHLLKIYPDKVLVHQ